MDVHDTQTGCKLIRRDVLEAVLPKTDDMLEMEADWRRYAFVRSQPGVVPLVRDGRVAVFENRTRSPLSGAGYPSSAVSGNIRRAEIRSL